MFNSIHDNTRNFDDIEVLVAVDEDDKITREYIDNHKDFSFVKWFIVKRSLNFSRDYYTFLAANSSGKWIIACNDDAMFETKDWDVIAEKTLNEYIGNGPNVVYGWIEDGLGEFHAKGCGKYCCFPLIGRDGFDALGCVFPDRIPIWGADIWIRKLYDNIDRVVDLPIRIKHICYHAGNRDQDHINKYIINNQTSYDVNPSYDEINRLMNHYKKLKGE